MLHDLNQKGFATRQIHAGAVNVPGINPLCTPIFQTSTFVFDDTAQGARRFAHEEQGFVYSRTTNPNATQVGEKLANLEGGEAGLTLGSGMGAITAAFWTILNAGDHVLADETLYGCTFSYFSHGLARFGVEVTYTDLSDPANVAKNLRKNTKIVYFETPANPNMKIIDIEAVSAAAHAYNRDIKVVIDNTFCTPYIQRPLEWGADVVVHSGTKYINGHGDVIAGMIVGKADFISECCVVGLKDMTGAAIGPFEAFLIARGLKTLDIRMERHSKNAMAVADFLESSQKVKAVYYPGLKSNAGYATAKKQMRLPGGMITFELNANKAQSETFINALELCSLAVSLGDTETLIQHPASMTHSTYTPEALKAAGISEGMIRLSVGLEDAEDIIADLRYGLSKI